jgi:hypothetical protein
MRTFREYFEQRALEVTRQAKEALDRVVKIKEHENPYDQLNSLERWVLIKNNREFAQKCIEELEYMGRLNASGELFEDIDYILEVNQVAPNEDVFFVILITVQGMRDFEESGISVKYYADAQKKLKGAIGVIEQYGGSIEEKDILPPKPEVVLNHCMSELERLNIHAAAVEAIVKFLGKRRRVPKGQESRREINKIVDRTFETLGKNIEYLGNGLIRVKNLDQ